MATCLLVDGKKVEFGKSITAFLVGAENDKYTNTKAIELKSAKELSLKVGKSSKIKAETVVADESKQLTSEKTVATLRYASSDKSVATVTSTGKIKAKAAGTCTIYVYAKNGKTEAIEVTVK